MTNDKPIKHAPVKAGIYWMEDSGGKTLYEVYYNTNEREFYGRWANPTTRRLDHLMVEEGMPVGFLHMDGDTTWTPVQTATTEPSMGTTRISCNPK